MKYDLYPIVLKELKTLYGLTDSNENHLYKYLYMRTAVFHDKRKVNNRELFNFVIQELNLSVHEDNSKLSNNRHLRFKGENYSIMEESSEFLDNLKFRAEMDGSLDMKEKMETVFRKGYQQARKYRKVESYEQHKMYCRLMTLNREFEANPVHPRDIEGFEISPNHNSMKRSLESELEVIIDASKRRKTNNTTHITEEMLESYLVDNIEKIEKGMVLLDSQVKVSNGIIDILAKDKNGKICIIELKIAEDKEIIWQALHYPTEIKKRYNSDIRMITVAPEYKKSIYEGLKSIGKVELMSYEIETVNSKITRFKITKFTPSS